MKQKLIPETSFCGCCRKELPLEAFYIEKNTQRPDRYCKECRRAASNMRYYHVQAAEHTHRYPVITETADRALRMALIMHAWQVVKESVARKRKRLREEDISSH